ncbi:MAG: hypothetical protein WBC93_16380, partial [Sulfitobacter sp.]
TYTRSGRSWATILGVAAVYLAAAVGFFVLDASPWLIGVLIVVTMPALWDLYRNPSSGLTLDDTELRWHSGRMHAELPLAELAFIRLDTRLDFSVRITAVLASGRKIRLPYEATPPHKIFEAELQARSIKSERHHFSLIG